MLNDVDRTADYRKQQGSKATLVKNRLKNLKSILFSPVVAFLRTGPETVVLVPPVARGGNWLYEWMRAEQASVTRQAPAFLLEAEGMKAWLSVFPHLKNYTRPPESLRFRSLRISGFSQDVEKDFSKEEIKNFIEKNLLSPEFQNRRQNAKSIVDENTIVINIRRGDYYSLEAIHKNFGIDTITYIQKALALSLEKGQPDKIVVTSDDLGWCKEHLSFLTEAAPTRFEKFGNDMFDDLAVLSVARRLILTNTTFGYWGAYIANLDYDAEIYAPNLHENTRNTSFQNRKIPIQHQSNWIQVTPPAGWSSWLESEKILDED